jgi:aryl-alcohol dehydrogenase-like predicted oxidoreductase
MPLNSYVTLGRSGLRVSPFCLGAMTFGEDWGWVATPEDSSKILGAFLERGGNFVDTANFYTKGYSEKVIGDFIAQDRARRERIVLATKFSATYTPVIRMAVALAARRSLRSASSRFAACRPTTSTSTGSI